MNDEMINAVETEVTEVVAETAKNGTILKEAGKYGIAAAVGAGLTILGEKLVKKGKKKRLEKKAKKAEVKEVSKVDQLCEEIENSLKTE